MTRSTARSEDGLNGASNDAGGHPHGPNGNDPFDGGAEKVRDTRCAKGTLAVSKDRS